jgi:hypothetical protein
MGVSGIFGIYVDFLRAVKGGFFLRKNPLERVLSVYTISENAIAARLKPCPFKTRLSPQAVKK